MLVSCNNVTFSYTGTPVIHGVTFALHEKERVGFLGANGEGKTTLLRLILGQLEPDDGSITLKNGVKIGYLEQTGGFESEASVYGAMEEVFAQDKELIARLRQIEAQMERAQPQDMHVLSAKYESLNKQISARDSYHFDVKIRTVLSGMGFGELHARKVSTMSGGEKTKLKLCRLLLEEPELLILDEPTNHLDVKTLFWLEDYLSAYKGALLIVSHDRYFLDRLTTRTLELERGEVFSYKGGYSKYKILKAERGETMRREYEKQREEIAKLQDYVNRNLVRATTAKSAQSRVKQLDKMDVLTALPPPLVPPRFRFTAYERPYERVLEAKNFRLQAGEKVLLNNASFTLMRQDKCALMGDNGTGKSTLLKYFLSNSSQISYGKLAKFAYYDQEQANFDGEERVLEAFWGNYPLLSQTDARAILARSGLDAEDIDKKVKELSGGLRAKLALALLQAQKANVLVLDEPTNHLDLPAREALEEALAAYDGTLLFVSHDRRFIQAVANKIVFLENGALTIFKGGLDEYLAQKKSEMPVISTKTVEKSAPSGNYRTKEERAKEAQTRNRIREIEQLLLKIEEEIASLNESLMANASNYQKVREITALLQEKNQTSERLYEEYAALID